MLNAEAFQDQGDKPVVEERGPYTFRWKKKAKVRIFFVTQAGGEKGQPGMASRPNRELPEKKVFLLREGDVRGTLGWYGMSPLGAVPELIQVMSLNLPMVGAVNYAKGDYLKEYGISEMLSTFEVLTIFFKASQLILLVVMMVRQGNLLRYSRYATRPVAPKDNHMINSEQFTQCIYELCIWQNKPFPNKYIHAKMLQHGTGKIALKQ